MNYIVNADDFGRNTIANQRIQECFKKGVISSATIMSNMPGFEEAIAIIKDNNYDGCVGVHVVLDEGRPLTKTMSECTKFCDKDGNYLKSIPRHQYLSGKERQIVYNEVLAQIDRIIDNGIIPTHLDSHRHRHMDIMIAMAVKKAMVERKIYWIRKHKTSDGALKRIYGFAVEKYYAINNTIHMCDKFYSIYDIKSIDDLPNEGNIEIMCHPEMDEDYSILANAVFNKDNMTNYLNLRK